MRSVALRMHKARTDLMSALNKTMADNQLPAYIIEPILADIIGELRIGAKDELINEMEQEYGNLGKGIQQSNVAQQTVNGNTDQ